MNAADTSHYLENQFINSTRSSRKRCKVLADDHNAKLTARAAVEGAPVTALVGNWNAVYFTWVNAYNTWRNALAARRSCTQKMDNLLAELRVTPPAGGRSKLDEWEGRIAGLFGLNDPLYQHFFPQGREPFTRQGIDATLSEVSNLSARLGSKSAELASAALGLQAQVDALTVAGAPVPESLTDALALATDRQNTVANMTMRVQTFYNTMNAARLDQQGRESDVDTAALEVEKQRVRICRRMYANMGTLIGHYTNIDSPAEEPQMLVAEYFQFETLKQSGPEEEPEPAPAPPVP